VIREIKPDILHAGPIQSCALLGALSGFRPLVSMSWGSDLLKDAERNALYRWATRYTLSRSDVLVGDCAPVRRAAIQYGMPDERIVTFPWGVDLEHFQPAGEQQSFDGVAAQEPPFTLLSTRIWEPLLGVDLIAQAFTQAARQRPDLRLVLLGNGSLAGQLRQTFGQAGVSEQVICPGQVGLDSLPRYYRAADLYVTASHSDGTSISLLEAMACGKPALVSDIPGNREWVTEGEQGWLFPDGDASALEQGILRAMDQPERLAEMGRNARRLAEQRADWDKNFLKLLDAYKLAMQYTSKKLARRENIYKEPRNPGK
jgi:glycosyltransferase involved in cell wall biosynthesis